MSMQARTYGAGFAPARRANDRIAERAAKLGFDARVPMRCECGEAGCSELVLLRLDDYAQVRESGRSVLAPGH